LKYFQNTLSGLGVDELLHLVMILLNSLVKKKAHTIVDQVGISFNMLELTCQLCAELND